VCGWLGGRGGGGGGRCIKNKSEDNTAEYPGREPEMQWPRDGAMYASKFVPGARVVKMLQDVVESSTYTDATAVLCLVRKQRRCLDCGHQRTNPAVSRR